MVTLSAVSALEIFSWIGYFLIALLCLMFMITIHEAGHYAFGKMLGFDIDEFSIGFGPALFKHKSKKTGELFAIRAIPIGGYCAFYGEEQDKEETNGKKSFNSHAPWKRIIVFIAGAAFNFISAIILITIFFMAYGDYMPKIAVAFDAADGIENVLQADDVILKVNGKSVYSMLDTAAFAKALDKSGEKANLTVLREGEKVEITAEKKYHAYVNDDGSTENRLGYGVTYGFERYKFGFFQSIGRAFVFIFKAVGTLFATLGSLFTGAIGVKESLGGTGTAIAMLMNLSKSGFDSIMYAVCVLSATLAVTNMLPIPALDGSKVVFTTIEWIRGKPINRRVENIIHTVGIVVLFGLMIVLDLIHFLS